MRLVRHPAIAVALDEGDFNNWGQQTELFLKQLTCAFACLGAALRKSNQAARSSPPV
jgi:hypothetical protein